MLPRDHRLTTSAEFTAVMGAGRRAGTRQLVVHLLATDFDRPARAGFVVSSKVGNSVVRHRVTRRLRAQLQPLLADMPAGTDLVVRALPSAGVADSASLSADLRYALRKCSHR